MSYTNYITKEDANELRVLITKIAEEQKKSSEEIIERISKLSSNMDAFLTNTSYINVITFLLKELSEIIGYEYLKKDSIVDRLIKKNSPIKIGNKRIIHNTEYELENIELGRNFGLELIFHDGKNNYFSWEAFD